jgi:hypothetical protein
MILARDLPMHDFQSPRIRPARTPSNSPRLARTERLPRSLNRIMATCSSKRAGFPPLPHATNMTPVRVAAATKAVPVEMESASGKLGALPRPGNPGLPGVAHYRAQVGQARLAVGEGWGGVVVVARDMSINATPTPNPSPQGQGYWQSVRSALVLRSARVAAMPRARRRRARVSKDGGGLALRDASQRGRACGSLRVRRAPRCSSA